MRAERKRVVLVAGHFPPSNLVNVHRARLWSQYLPEFGWEPIVVTTHHAHYEERLDWALLDLIDPGLPVIRTGALPTRPLRVIGDVGIRALLPHYLALCRLAAEGRMDFLHITIPSNYSALLGRMVHARYAVPYGIDYNDPWVHDFPGSDRPLTKAWASARLARVLEPWAVRDASLITGVAAAYYEAVLARNPRLRERAVTAAMPFGISEKDFAALDAAPRPTTLFASDDGLFHVVYAGALLPKAYPLLEILFQGLSRLRERQPELVAPLRLHFVGTGKSPDDPNGHNVLPYIERYALQALVREHPTRIAYLDVLNHLRAASANLVLGSTERHYTPSKAFQVVQAGRPALAILHADSTAATFLRRAQAGEVVAFGDGQLPTVEAMTAALEATLRSARSPRAPADLTVFESFTARHSARLFARALDDALRRDSSRAHAAKAAV
jgi:hypothetical protein